MTTASDDFNRANETPVASPWESVIGGGINLSGNLLLGTASTAKASRYNSGTWGDDQRVDAVIGGLSASANYAELYVRLTSGGNGYKVYTDGTSGGCAICRVDAGSEVVLQIVTGLTFTNGDTAGIGVSGTTLTVYKNNVAQTPTATDSTYTTGGLPGAGSYGAATIDDWTATDGGAAAASVKRLSLLGVG